MLLPGLVQFRKCTLTDQELAEKVADGLAKMYTPPVRVPDRPVPADPDNDFDLFVGELVYRFSKRVPISYLIKFDRYELKEVAVKCISYNEKDLPHNWAVKMNDTKVMSKIDGQFFYPCCRDDEFFEEFRFPSYEEAVKCYERFYGDDITNPPVTGQ